jgi:hypothetical protein
MVIAEFSSIDGPKEPLPGPLRRGADPPSGIRPFAAAYAKQGSERQDIVRFLPGFRPKVIDGGATADAAVLLDRLKWEAVIRHGAGWMRQINTASMVM